MGGAPPSEDFADCTIALECGWIFVVDNEIANLGDYEGGAYVPLSLFISIIHRQI